MENVATRNGFEKRNDGRDVRGTLTATRVVGWGRKEREGKERREARSFFDDEKLCRSLSTGIHRGTIAIMRKLRSRRVRSFPLYLPPRLCFHPRSPVITVGGPGNLLARTTFGPGASTFSLSLLHRPQSRPHNSRGSVFLLSARVRDLHRPDY